MVFFVSVVTTYTKFTNSVSVDLSAEEVLKQLSEVAFPRKSCIQPETKFETHGTN